MRAVVVGAGVAGPVAALAMRQAGIEVEVHEAYPVRAEEVGSYLTVSPNGLDALDAVDALDVVGAVAFPTRINVMIGSTGRELGRIALGRPLDDGTPALTMKRSRLTEVLTSECARRGVVVVHDSRVINAVQENDRVRVTFGDGHTQLVDVLVGADGVRSSVRTWVDPHAPAARYVGLTNFGGITRGAASWAGAEHEAWRFIFGRDAFFGYIPTPGGDVVWFVNEPRRQITVQERLSTTNAQWAAHLARLFSHDAGPAARLIREGVLELAGDNTFDLGHVPRWHRGALVVIGDAAHAPAPSSGQGASMAMEDGVILALCLRDADSVESAFAAYEWSRRERVERIVAAGARSSSSKTPNRFVRPLRDVGLQMVFRLAVTERSTAWIYDHRIDWERGVVGVEDRTNAR
ncbi:MAG: FAD-dependent monooxygenase [Actinomycetota bacterium]|nr:FAD-dependent monooxygenase [Actinomycetota bacterium]